eukprot:1007378-Prorocentrum_minimum.AAC.2
MATRPHAYIPIDNSHTTINTANGYAPAAAPPRAAPCPPTCPPSPWLALLRPQLHLERLAQVPGRLCVPARVADELPARRRLPYYTLRSFRSQFVSRLVCVQGS